VCLIYLLNKIFFINFKFFHKVIKNYKNYCYVKKDLVMLHTITLIYILIHNYIFMRDISDIIFIITFLYSQNIKCLKNIKNQTAS